ncbi:MAG: hypothetical protein JST84_11305 [Acidobacteria bacterium]|nr:hypothetical protein [Acidobacteriota bacterium]
MPASADHITVKIERRDQSLNYPPNFTPPPPLPPKEIRTVFWSPMTKGDATQIPTMEFKVTAELGKHLKNRLINHLDEELMELQRVSQMHGQEEKEIRAAVARLLEKRSVATSLIISVKIEGYSSLELSLDFGSFEKIASIFDSNFDDFRVFLDAFIPLAFMDVFGEGFTRELEFEERMPTTTERAFYEHAFTSQQQRVNLVPQALPPLPPLAIPPPPPPAQEKKEDSERSKAMERAQWLWRLANGSLVVPVILALVVLYYAAKELSAAKEAQFQAVKAIMEQQVNGLKEDRERFNTLAAMILKKADGTTQKTENGEGKK